MKQKALRTVSSLLAAILLTGCAWRSSAPETAESTDCTASQTDTAVSTDSTLTETETTSCVSQTETTASGTDNTDASGTAESTGPSGGTAASTDSQTGISGDMKTAKKVMEQYLSATAKGNQQQVLKCTNLEWYADLMKAIYPDRNISKDDMIHLLYESLVREAGKTGRIVRCGENKKLLRELRNEISSLQQNIGELEGDDKKMAETVLARYRIPDHLFVFQIDTGSDGSAAMEYYTVSMIDGAATVDLTAQSSLSKYTQISRVTSANSCAKAVMDSMNETLKLLAPQTDEVNRIDGTHEFSAKEFRNAKEPDQISGRSDLFEALCWQAYQKAHSSLQNAKSVMITVKNCKVTAAAVQMKTIEDPVTGEDMSVFGSAPREVGYGELIGVLTLESVLKKAGG